MFWSNYVVLIPTNKLLFLSLYHNTATNYRTLLTTKQTSSTKVEKKPTLLNTWMIKKDLLCAFSLSLNKTQQFIMINRQMKTVENYCSACIPSLTSTFLIVALLSSQWWETLQQPHVSEDFQPHFPSITNPPLSVCFDHRHVIVSYLISTGSLCLLSKGSVENLRG